ncbi:MAG: hypothetical protein WCF90_07210 [Methanomicrobiales archaeon]
MLLVLLLYPGTVVLKAAIRLGTGHRNLGRSFTKHECIMQLVVEHFPNHGIGKYLQTATLNHYGDRRGIQRRPAPSNAGMTWCHAGAFDSMSLESLVTVI